MVPEKDFFLKTLSDFLAQRSTTPVEGLDWSIIASIARSHQVIGIIYYQCNKFISKDFLPFFEKTYYSTLYYYTNRKQTLKVINEAFHKSNIPILTVKGLEVADCYPVPALRTMGDIDILVHKEDKARAGSCLEKMGFQIGEKNPDYDWTCTLNGMQYELHHNLIYHEAVTKEVQACFFNDFWDYQTDGHLEWNFHFLFLLAHMRKHILNYGIGFRMFMDIAAVIKNRSLNWQWIEERLNQLGMKKYATVCFALVYNWFEIKVPLVVPSLEKSFIEEATEKVFSDGIFGFENENNKDNDAINYLIGHEHYSWFSRLGYFFKLSFPCYNNMANSPYYHFVRGKPWLLPIAWIYRIIRLIKGDTNDIQSIMKDVMISRKTIEKRESELKRWGLIE